MNGKNGICSCCSAENAGVVRLQFNEELEEKYNQETIDSGVKKLPICSDCLSNSMALFMERSLPKVRLFNDLVHSDIPRPKSA